MDETLEKDQIGDLSVYSAGRKREVAKAWFGLGNYSSKYSLTVEVKEFGNETPPINPMVTHGSYCRTSGPANDS